MTDLIVALREGCRPGIYAIECEELRLVYVGQSINPIGRLSQHWTGRGRGTGILNAAIEQFGRDRFAWKILEHCSEPLLKDRELFWTTDYFRRGFGLLNRDPVPIGHRPVRLHRIRGDLFASWLNPIRRQAATP